MREIYMEQGQQNFGAKKGQTHVWFRGEGKGNAPTLSLFPLPGTNSFLLGRNTEGHSWKLQ